MRIDVRLDTAHTDPGRADVEIYAVTVDERGRESTDTSRTLASAHLEAPEGLGREDRWFDSGDQSQWSELWRLLEPWTLFGDVVDSLVLYVKTGVPA